jgi:hypothetical protein
VTQPLQETRNKTAKGRPPPEKDKLRIVAASLGCPTRPPCQSEIIYRATRTANCQTQNISITTNAE